MKKTYSEINEVALDLYGASSSKKEEWVEEYEAYLHGEGNTVWNDEEFADWTDEDKKECYDIIISLYDEKEGKHMTKQEIIRELIKMGEMHSELYSASKKQLEQYLSNCKKAQSMSLDELIAYASKKARLAT